MNGWRAWMACSVVLGVQATANAASLRRVATLHAATVKLSDLFDNLQPGQDCEIGPAPPPGQRILIPPSQVAAIAAQFGVELQSTDANRGASLDRPGRTVRHDEVIDALKPALIAAGMPAASDIDLGIFASPTIAAESDSAPSVTGLDYDSQTGRFSATLQFAGSDIDPQSIRVTGRGEEMTQSFALLHPVMAGSAVGASDVTPVRVRKSALHGVVVMDMTQAAGLVARQTLPAGTDLTQDLLVRPVLVTRGRPVVLRLSSGGLALTAAGTALESGGDGDRIHVMNSATRAVLVGVVLDGSDVSIDPGTAPVFMAQSGNAGQLPRPDNETGAAVFAQNTYSAQEARRP